jgi:hypothetical protein
VNDNHVRDIADLARREQTIVLAPDYASTGVYYVRESDGDMRMISPDRDLFTVGLPPGDTRHAHTDSLVRRIAADMADVMHETWLRGIYVSSTGIVATLATRWHAWRHTLPMPLHPVFAEVQALTRPRAFTQRDLIHWLRSTMNGHVPDADVEQFRALRISTEGDTATVVAKGREGVDRRIAATIRQQAGADVPDSLTVQVPVFDLEQTIGEYQVVHLLVDVRQADDGAAQFVVTAVHDGLRTALRDAVDHVRVLLAASIDAHGGDMVRKADMYDGTPV